MADVRSLPPGMHGVFAREASAVDLLGIAVQADVSHAREGAAQAVLCGRPRWRDRDLAELALRFGHAAALLEGYCRYREQVLEHLHDEFALVVFDPAAGELLLATDRIGIRPLYYSADKARVVFGLRADVVAAHPAVDDRLSAQGLYDYLYFHVVPGPGSIFDKVVRLMPGEALGVRGGRLSVFNYWRPRYDASAGANPKTELKQRFRDLVGESVRDAVGRAPGRVGAFLSGGTDSSTVAGMLASIGGESARTYSIGFDAPGYDEMAYARLAARHFGTRHHEYYVTPRDVVEAVPRIAASVDQPFGNASIVPAYYCARMAREDGMDCMFAGDGGDELFGGNYRYAKQQMFEAYQWLPSALRRGVVEPLLLGMPGAHAIPGVRKLRSYVAQARAPMPERMESYNLLQRLGAENVLTVEWLAGADPEQPRRQVHQCYHGVQAQHMIDRMLAVDMRFTLADSDLPKVNHACRLAGVGVSYPWLDERLMAFAATLPAHYKVRGTRLRYLFKEALKGFLPDEIIAKRKQGFGLPFGIWLNEHEALRDLAGDSLEGLVRRGIIRPGAVDLLLGQQSRDHAAYYATFVWILMMLEQWLAGRDTEGAWK